MKIRGRLCMSAIFEKEFKAFGVYSQFNKVIKGNSWINLCELEIAYFNKLTQYEENIC